MLSYLEELLPKHAIQRDQAIVVVEVCRHAHTPTTRDT